MGDRSFRKPSRNSGGRGRSTRQRPQFVPTCDLPLVSVSDKDFDVFLRRVQRKAPEVREDIQRAHAQTLAEAWNFLRGLRGTVVAVKTLRAGQPRAYADSEWESLIFTYLPNVYTTGGLVPRWITAVEAEALARKFVHEFSDSPGPFQARLVRLEPAPFLSREAEAPSGTAYCWRVVIRQPYCD